MNDWLQTLNALANEDKACVLVTVAHTAGSAPREAGTKMVVSADNVYGTIGGGNLEFDAIQTARSFLTDSPYVKHDSYLDLYALGPMLEQCCGGVVFLHYELIKKDNCDWLGVLNELDDSSVNAIVVTRTGKEDSDQFKGEKLIVTEFETSGSLGDLDENAIKQARQLLDETGTFSPTFLHPLSASKGSLPDISDALLFDVIRPGDFHIAIYGAGHVGSAIVDILEKSVSCRISWVDSRADAFPETLPVKVSAFHGSMPTNTVQDMPPDSFYLVMTHSHSLDRALCEAILKRDYFQFLGLIGSETKRKRFHRHLLEKGFSEKVLSRLTCPIGIHGIDSKEPGAIAVSVVAQLLRIYEENRNSQTGSDENNNVYSL